MNETTVSSARGQPTRRHFLPLLLVATLLVTLITGQLPIPAARAQGPIQVSEGTDPASPSFDEEVERSWKPAYLTLATGDPTLSTSHSVYDWPFALDSIGWNMQSYQDYGGIPYFHHGMDMMKAAGTHVYNRSGGQVINVENYEPPQDIYWEVAILDSEGYIWQYHHVDHNTIPQYIWDKFAEYQSNPIYGGFISANTYIGDIVTWPIWSFGKQFNHIHLNILAAGGVYVNGFSFHTLLPDMSGPQIQGVGLLKNGMIYLGNEVDGDYSLYVHARDLILDDVYYVPPWDIGFSVDGGPEETTWRFFTLPGGADDTAYLDDFYVVPPTCGDYDCRDFYIDLGFIPGSQYQFPCTGGGHSVLVTVRDYTGNSMIRTFNYTVTNYPPVANPQTVTMSKNAVSAITLSGSDQNCDPLTYSLVSNPSHGTLAGAAPYLLYYPASDYYGPDSFTFIVNDGVQNSAPATVNITVGAAVYLPLIIKS